MMKIIAVVEKEQAPIPKQEVLHLKKYLPNIILNNKENLILSLKAIRIKDN